MSMPHFGRATLAAVAAAVCLGSCSPPEPLKIGFLGGLSGRVTDLGTGGLNGVRLAVELRNKSGGVKGRPVELIEEDDQQDAETARQAVGRLIERKVAAVIGPMTSAMAIATLPQINDARLVMVSPTVSSEALSGLDDHFFRVASSTRHFARQSAEHYARAMGLRRIRPVFDLRNKSYTESWLRDFSAAFKATGGSLLEPLGFTSGEEPRFASLAGLALADAPDGIVILGNSVDTAMLCQSIRKIDPSIPIATSEWAATERLIELGGKAVEGVVIAQLIDRRSTEPSFIAFQNAYVTRFGQTPGFAGLYGFDAANVVFAALENKAAKQTLKEALLAQKTFAGTQKAIVFDDYGDTQGGTQLYAVRNGEFIPIAPFTPRP